jgi:hypothetical protein
MNRLAKADGLLKAALMYEPSDLPRAGWYQEAREYIDGLQSVETVLADLVEQITVTDPTYSTLHVRVRSLPGQPASPVICAISGLLKKPRQFRGFRARSLLRRPEI